MDNANNEKIQTRVNFVNNVLKVLDTKKISLSNFASENANVIGVSEDTIKSWLTGSGRKEPKLSNAINLAKALGVSLDSLCGDDSVKEMSLLLKNIVADNPNYKVNFDNESGTLFSHGEKSFNCESIYLPLSKSRDDRPIYKGDLKFNLSSDGICKVSIDVDTVAGKRARYSGIAIYLNPKNNPTYWCLLKLDEQSEGGIEENTVPAEFITYSFLAPKKGWKSLIVQVGNLISNSKNPALFRALFIKREKGDTDSNQPISDDDLKQYFKGFLEIYDLQQIPIHKDDYDRLERYVNNEPIADCDAEYLNNYFKDIDTADLEYVLRKYFTQPDRKSAPEVYYLNPIEPPDRDKKEGDQVRLAILMAWFRGQGNNPYINEVDQRESNFAERIYQWLTEIKK